MVRLEPDDGSRARRDLRRVKKLDRKHDIPYLAGYSQDGKTIYIDRHMPQNFKFRGRRSTPTASSSCTRRSRRR